MSIDEDDRQEVEVIEAIPCRRCSEAEGEA